MEARKKKLCTKGAQKQDQYWHNRQPTFVSHLLLCFNLILLSNTKHFTLTLGLFIICMLWKRSFKQNSRKYGPLWQSIFLTFGILALYNGVRRTQGTKTSSTLMAIIAPSGSICACHTSPLYDARISNGLSSNLFQKHISRCNSWDCMKTMKNIHLWIPHCKANVNVS